MEPVVSRLRDAVSAYFVRREWPLEDHGDYLATLVSGKNGEWSAYFDIRENEDQIAVHSMVPVEIPDDQRTNVALFLTRANFGLAVGNFEFDLDDGETRYKTSIDLGGVDASDDLVDRLFTANIVTVDHYLPGLRAAARGEDPALAVSMIEGSHLHGRISRR